MTPFCKVRGVWQYYVVGIHVWLIDLERVSVALNIDHSVGAGRPGTRPYNIVIRISVPRSSQDVPIVKFVGKSLLGSSPHDVITYGAELQNADVIRWSLHQNWGRGWNNFIFLHRSRTVPYRFEVSVGVWHVWCEHDPSFSYKSHKIVI